jgi:hypothetical protein
MNLNADKSNLFLMSKRQSLVVFHFFRFIGSDALVDRL